MQVDLATLFTAEPTEPRWVVDGMLAQGTVVILAGAPGVGKSLLSYTLAMSVALGRPFLARTTPSQRVLYFDEENSQQDQAQYCRWIWRGMGCPPVDTLAGLRIEHYSLWGEWRNVMQEACHAHHPGLIIIDTASSCLHVQDENDNAEAARLMAILHSMQRLSGPDTTILLLKHERVDEAGRRTVRGAKMWMGAVDGIYYHSHLPGRPPKDGLRPTRIIPEKVRAFGLKEPVHILPQWTSTDPKGLILLPFDA